MPNKPWRIPFGKYRGHDMYEIAYKDPNHLRALIDDDMTPSYREAAREALDDAERDRKAFVEAHKHKEGA